MTENATKNNSDLSNMYSYRKTYVEKELNNFKIENPKNFFDSKDEENITVMHYYGLALIDSIYTKLSKNSKLVDDSVILNAGSGYAGDSRYWTQYLNKTHKLVNCEFFKETHNFAVELTNQCESNISKRNIHVNENLVDHDFGQKFNAIFSVLVILHIEKKFRLKLFKNMANHLHVGGQMFIEDFIFPTKTKNMSDQVYDSVISKLIGLGSLVSHGELPIMSEYLETLESAGFTVISYEDVSDSFKTFVQARLKAYKNEKLYAKKVNLHGEENGPRQFLKFFETICEMFNTGYLGVKILVQKV